MTENKEQARKKAEKKCLELAMKGLFVAIEKCSDRFRVVRSNHDVIDFHFTDLKDGDVCFVDWGGCLTTAIYNKGKYYEITDYAKRFRGEKDNVTLITKTGFNILDYLKKEGQK